MDSPKIRGDSIATAVVIMLLLLVVVLLSARFVEVDGVVVVVVILAMTAAYSTAATTILGNNTKSPTSDEARIAWMSTISNTSLTDSTVVLSHNVLFSLNGDEKNDDNFTVSSRRK